MKKNRMMRLASGLLVAVLATTSMISGTYAKYVTSAEASDAARVARWGVEVVTAGSLFGTMYDDKANGNKVLAEEKDTMTVASFNETSVVAPGTKNEEGLKFSITGTTEVAVKVDVVVTDANGENPVDVFLKGGEYLDMTTGTSTATVNGVATVTGADDTFLFTGDYYPITYVLKDADDGTVLAEGNLDAIESALEALTDDFIPPNTNLAEVYGNYTITWGWAFPDTESKITDQKDTFLGALAVDTSLTSIDNYSLATDLKVAITVTQVD